MIYSTAEYFKEMRLAKKLTTGALAAAAGYKNVNKAVRNIQGFEDVGVIDPAQLGRLGEILELVRVRAMNHVYRVALGCE